MNYCCYLRDQRSASGLLQVVGQRRPWPPEFFASPWVSHTFCTHSAADIQGEAPTAGETRLQFARTLMQLLGMSL